MKTKFLIVFLFLIPGLVSCLPARSASPVSTSDKTSSKGIGIPPTPTEFHLPFNDQNVESDYCQLPSIKLPASDAQGLSDDEIAEKLMILYLMYFSTANAPDWCRIDGYRIDKIYYDERTPSLSLEPKGDVMRVALYSIRLIQVPNFWMSFAGEVDQQNWLHTGANLAIFRLEDGYTMQFARP